MRANVSPIRRDRQHAASIRLPLERPAVPRGMAVRLPIRRSGGAKNRVREARVRPYS